MLYPVVLETEDSGAVSAYVPGVPLYAAAETHAKAGPSPMQGDGTLDHFAVTRIVTSEVPKSAPSSASALTTYSPGSVNVTVVVIAPPFPF
jgi:hypothetical protein